MRVGMDRYLQDRRHRFGKIVGVYGFLLFCYGLSTQGMWGHIVSGRVYNLSRAYTKGRPSVQYAITLFCGLNALVIVLLLLFFFIHSRVHKPINKL